MRNIYQKLTDNRETIPFQSSEDAWFWYCLCEQLGFEVARPCESSDILIAVKRLMREGLLKPEHIQILQKYGFEQTPPHVNFGATERICRLWREAMGFLDSLLRRKGIVGCFFLI